MNNGRNITFPIYNQNGTSFHGLSLKRSTVNSVVMSLGDKITGDVYYDSISLPVTMGEYIMYNGVKYSLINPPTILREGMVADNSDLKGMTKYSFEFYHPMYHLLNFPFSDVAVTNYEKKYLSQDKTFSWIGNLVDYVAKINKNLEGTEWICVIGNSVSSVDKNKLSEVMTFNNVTIGEVLKRGYETWEIPYVIDNISSGQTYYNQGKRFLIQFGLPSQEILGANNQPFVFQFGQGVGLKNNSRTPRNNKIITRLSGYGSEDNIPYGYPQIVWTGNQTWDYTINNSFSDANSYPIYDGVVGGEKVRLIKHPFTRSHLMPSIYRETVNKKVNPYATGYDPTIEIKDYYDANGTYPNPIVQGNPSYDIHEFGEIKPELGSFAIVDAFPYNETTTDGEAVLLANFTPQIIERATSTGISIERSALYRMYENVVRNNSLDESGSDESYNYSSKIVAGDRYDKVEFVSTNYNFKNTVYRDGTIPQESTDWVDDIDEDGNYKQGYFKITLPILSFDIYACAALTQEMSIVMRSGACIGCTFSMQVDWDDYRKNFYDANGNFLPDGVQRDLNKYPKSDEEQITVIVQKDTNTFGTLMPNIYQYPSAGDNFVIIGISLPNSYIISAESRLDNDMKQYMRDNNVYYFDYPLKFDEHFLATHIDILSQIKPNTIIRFLYNNEQLALYVKQLTIKYDNTPLPQYDITLTDDIEVVLNQVGQVTEEVSRLRVLIGQGAYSSVGGETIIEGDSRYLRKDIDDTTSNQIRSLKGFQLGESFNTGLLGEGSIWRVDADGKTYLEVDKLYARMRFYADTVEVRRYLHTGGNNIKSPAGVNCTRVEYIDSNGDVTSDPSEAVKYRCYFKATDNDKKITNDFVVGDLAFCGETNVDNGSLSQHRYWRAVVGRNEEGITNENDEMWIDLSATDCESGSDIPIAQDDIIQLGNKTDTTRQGAIIEYVSGDDAPSYMIYQNIDSYSLNGKNKLALGYNSSTNRAYLNVYGDFFFGNPEKDLNDQYTGSYIKYNARTGALEIKGSISATSTIGSSDFDTYVKAHQNNYDDTDVYNYINEVQSDLQEQIDGAVETISDHGEPTGSNDPYASLTPQQKERHIGDMYYDIDTGYAYRYIKDGSTFYWQLIEDSDVQKAIADAAQALLVAGGKGKIFTTTEGVLPTPPYNVNDVWVNATYPANATHTDKDNHIFYNDILKCVTARAEGGTPSINDWIIASKYTDDSYVENWITNTYAPFTQSVQTQIDGKAETWYQSTNPANNWTTTDLRNLHIGDIWHNTSNSTVGGVESNRDAIWDGTAWVMSDVPSSVYNTIDGKADIFVSKPTTYNVNDMWIIEEGLAAADMPTGCKHKDIVISSAKRTNSYNPSDWTKKDRYTDDTALTTFINGAYDQFKQSIQTQVDGKAETWVMSANPASQWNTTALKDEHVGDMWLNTSNGTIASVGTMQTAIYTKSGSTYSWVVNNNIPNSVFDKIDGKRAIYVTWSSITTAMSKGALQARDLYIPSSTTTQNNVTYTKNKVYRCTNVGAYSDGAITTYPTFTEVAYTDDTNLNSFIAQILNGTGASGNYATAGSALYAIKHALTDGETYTSGGLVLSNLLYLGTGSVSSGTFTPWSGINGVYKTSETGSDWKGHGIAAWYGGAMGDWEVYKASHPSATITNSYAKSLFRFDGSGYLASGNITWDKNGNVAIKDITTLIGGNNTDILNGLTTFNNAFHFATQQGSTTVLSISPQAGFTSLNITEGGVLKPVMTRDGSGAAKRIPYYSSTTSTTSMAGLQALNEDNALEKNRFGLYITGTTYGNTAADLISGVEGLLSFGDGGPQIVMGGTEQHLALLATIHDKAGGGASLHLVSNQSRVVFNTQEIVAKSRLSIGVNVPNTAYPLYVNGNAYASRFYLADGVYLEYDSDNLGVHLVGAGFYSDSYVSALGANSSGGGGGGGTGIDRATLFTILGGTPASGEQINTAFLNLSSYATQSWVTSNYVTLSTAQTISGAKTFSNTITSRSILPSSTFAYNLGSEDNRYNYLYGSKINLLFRGTTADNGYSGIYLANSDTTTGATNAYARLYLYNDHLSNNNGTLLVHSTGDAIFGGGEGVYALANLVRGTNTTNYEYTYIAADGQIWFDANCGENSNAATARRGFGLSRSGNIVPTVADAWTNNAGQIGTTAYRWNYGYFNNLDANTLTIGGNAVLHLGNYTTYTYSSTASRTANYVLAAPNGSNGAASFRHLVPADLYTHSSTNAISNDNTEILTSYNSDRGFEDTTYGNRLYRRPALSIWTYIRGKITADTALNVASATKLQTTRTLWGQSFNGTANVSGNMTGVGTLSASGNITITKTTTAESKFVATNSNGTIELLSSTNRGIYNRDASKWVIATNGTDTWMAQGNVGIGTTSPSYKLHVSGTAYASSLYLARDTVYMTSNGNDALVLYHNGDAGLVAGIADIHPASTNSGMTLGTSTYPWSRVYSIAATFTGNVTIGGTLGVTGATTLSSTLGVSGNTTLNGNLTLGTNNKYLYGTTTGGTEIELLRVSASDNLLVGYGFRTSGNTLIYGTELKFRTNGTTDRLVIDSTGNSAFSGNVSTTGYLDIGSVRLSWDSNNNALKVAGTGGGAVNIYATGGVSALGVASSVTGSITASLVPDTTTTYNLGSSSYRFNYLYARYVNASGNSTFSANVRAATMSVNAAASSTYVLYVSGNAYTTGTWGSSDERLKNVIKDVSLDVYDIAKAPIVEFSWKKNPKGTQLGSIAQYWDNVLPMAVMADEKGYKSMQYGETALACAVAIAKRTLSHEERIKALEIENEMLKERIKKLEAA